MERYPANPRNRNSNHFSLLLPEDSKKQDEQDVVLKGEGVGNFPDEDGNSDTDAQLGYRKISGGLDLHDRERNPKGGIPPQFPRARDDEGGREINWDAQEYKDAKKKSKFCYGPKNTVARKG